MIDSPKRFTGLNMPVFTAFGWAGEETALKYALSQLELFIEALHARLPNSIQAELPYFGLNQLSQSIYLAAAADVESDVHIAFYARPMSLEIQLVVSDKKTLAKGLKRAIKEPTQCHHLVTQLGPEWNLRVQQMQVDVDSGLAVHYMDLFKDTVKNLDETSSAALFEKADYLNNEDQWVTPIYLSRRHDAEQISAMGMTVLDIMLEQIANLMSPLLFLSGKVKKVAPAKTGKGSRSRTKETAVAHHAEATVPDTPFEDEFVYVSELMPLHIRRGFINLTPEHWPFFALNARTETRPVTVYYSGIYDKKSAMWRLQPDDQARLVLSPVVHEWLEGNFSPNDKVKITARKINDKEIQVSLSAG